LQYFNLCGGLT